MRAHAAPWVAVVAVGGAMAGGIYLAGLLDRALGWVVAGGQRARPWVSRPRPDLPLREAALLALQSSSSTERPDPQAWALAPALLAGVASVGLAVVPLAPGLAAADVESGIVLFGAAMALVMVAVFLEGWSANSPFSLVAGYRFVAQALSYEMPLALVLIAAALPARSLGISEVVASQAHLWNVLRQPLGLPLYLVAALGLAFWGPLALPEGRDLAGGTSAELSGLALLAWQAARRAVLVAVSALGAAVFLGGWQGPLLPGAAWTVLKSAALLALLVSARHFLGRVRLERFVVVSWAVLIPLALLDVLQAGVQALLAGR